MLVTLSCYSTICECCLVLSFTVFGDFSGPILTSGNARAQRTVPCRYLFCTLTCTMSRAHDEWNVKQWLLFCRCFTLFFAASLSLSCCRTGTLVARKQNNKRRKNSTAIQYNKTTKLFCCSIALRIRINVVSVINFSRDDSFYFIGLLLLPTYLIVYGLRAIVTKNTVKSARNFSVAKPSVKITYCREAMSAWALRIDRESVSR